MNVEIREWGAVEPSLDRIVVQDCDDTWNVPLSRWGNDDAVKWGREADVWLAGVRMLSQRVELGKGHGGQDADCA